MDTFHQPVQGRIRILRHAYARTDALCFPQGHAGWVQAVTQSGQAQRVETTRGPISLDSILSRRSS